MTQASFRVLRRDDQCPDGNTCEAILRFDGAPPEIRHVIFKVESDPAKIAATRHLVGHGELLGYTALIPDVE